MPMPPEDHFMTAWRGCDCTDVQAKKSDLPDRCPHHDTPALGVLPIRKVATGHRCDTSDRTNGSAA